MVQDEVDQKMVTLTVSTSKFTAKVFYQCLDMHYKQLTNPEGKQSLKHLKKKGEGIEQVDLDKENMKQFKKSARKYGVDFAVTKEKGSDPPLYHIHFKAPNEDCINSAIKDTIEDLLKKKTKLPLKQRLAQKVQCVGKSLKKTIKKVMTR